MQFLRKLFDTSKRDVDSLLPLVNQINDLEPELANLSDEQLKAKTPYFKEKLAGGATLDQIAAEAFAVVREVSKRTLGMRHFDVQQVGGMVLHQGRIAEMRTGEGKTLVAVAPLYLNALVGKGAHLVTVNDYLARRDAVWMGPIYHFLGMTVGIIQGQSADSDELGGSYQYVPGAPHEDPRYTNLVPISRRQAYLCDITYGTNHEFGFDYLRDNMAFNVEDLSMRELHYALIDEVDSILVDEARTPHIISGPSSEDVSVYRKVDEIVRQLKQEEHWTSDKKNHSASLTEEGMDLVEELLEIDNIASDPRLFHHTTASVKAYALFDKDVDYVVRNGEVVLVDENTGRMMFGRRLSDGLHQALEAKERVTVQRESQTVAVITFQNLFRLYDKLAGMTGTAKTEEDEFRKIYGLDVVCVPTHRTMVRDDQGDTIFKTEEAKFRTIGWDILRLYTKQQPVLVGTRSIDMTEKVSSRLSADMLQKLLLITRLRDMAEVSKTLPKELRKEALEIVNTGLNDLSRQNISALLSKAGTNGDPLDAENMNWAIGVFELSSDNLEYLEEALKHGIPHNVLNAKYHEKEALIVAEAGRKGQVTIATNMAGRGVDILLGGRVSDDIVEQARTKEDDTDWGESDEYSGTFVSYRRGGKERAAPPLPLDDTERREKAEEVRALGGLYILGTERHESRRIDNQLRGRSGRQGDPGVSKYYVSLEDMLWKIFNANMLENPMLKAWPEMEEVNAKFLSRMIEKTQERIENHYFESRKNTLEYDDVLNAQREHIYGMRRDILLGKHIRDDLKAQVDALMEDKVGDAWAIDEHDQRVYDYDLLYEDLNEMFPIVDFAKVSDLEQHTPGPDLVEYVQELAHKAYDAKAENMGDEVMQRLEQMVMLTAVNEKWMEHLQTVEYIREGIGLRGYGQIDPLIAYKQETYNVFQNTLKDIRERAVKMIYQAELRRQEEEPMQMARIEDEAQPVAAGVAAGGGGTALAIKGQAAATPANVDWKHVGRNEMCPCGSGKKFKSCHYPELRAQGVI